MAQASSAKPLLSNPSSLEKSGKKSGKKVAFDSSFLIAVMERPTPWNADMAEKLGTFTPVMLSSVRDELSRLAAVANKKGRFAALALSLLKKGMFSLEPDGNGRPDDEMISFALRSGKGAAIATVDSDLAHRLRAARAQTVVITLRGGRVSTY